jgi:hypothetical protein
MGTHYILQLFYGTNCSEISSPIIQSIKTPLRTHNFFMLAGSHKKELLNFMGMNISDRLAGLLNADFICVIASQGKMADAMGFSVA